MKKLLIIFLLLTIVAVFALPVIAHPQVPEQSKNVAPAKATEGLHTACPNLEGIAFHVLLYRVGPGPH